MNNILLLVGILMFIILGALLSYYNMQDLQYFKEAYGQEKGKDYNGDGILQYKNWDGKIIDEIQHQFRMQICLQMAIFQNVIDVNTRCPDVVLTSEGESMINDFVAQKYLSGDLTFSD